MGTRAANPLFSKRRMGALFAAVGLAELRVVMREYPLLASLYMRKAWPWPLALRNWLAAHPTFDWLGTECFVFGTKPHRP
jgi:hypothetical protein